MLGEVMLLLMSGSAGGKRFFTRMIRYPWIGEIMRASFARVVSEKFSFLGFSLYWSWLLLAFYSDVLAPQSLKSSGDAVEFVWLWTACFHFLGLIGMALSSAWLEKRMGSLVLRHGGCAGTAFGTALIMLLPTFCDTSTELYSIGLLICIAVLGFSSAWLLIQWCSVYVTKLSRSRSALLILSYTASLVVYLVIMMFPAELRSVIMILSLFLCAVGLERCRVAEPETQAAKKTKQKPLTMKRSGELVGVFAMFVAALCGEVLRSFSVQLANETVNFMGALYALGSLVGSIVFFLSFGVASPSPARVTMPLIRNCFLSMASAVLIIPLISEWSVSIAYALFGAGFWAFRAITWAMCFNYIQRTGLSTVRIVAIMDAAFTLAPIVSGRLVPLLSGHLSSTSGVSLTASIMIYILLATIIFLSDGRRASMFEDLELIADLDSELLSDSPKGSGGDVLAFRLNAATSGPDPIEILAQRYGLSARETEVFALLARGRSLPYIQNELVISEGTAQTHARHIYAKMGVHSRQELHDLVDCQLGREN